MDNQKKLELLEELFEVDAGELDAAAELTSLDNWDSMTKLSLIVMMDDECGKKLTGDTIKGFKTVQDILDYMD